MNTRISNRILSFMLCIVMLVGLMPTSVFAEDECAHTNAVFYDFEGIASSCFEPGVGGYWFCEDCSQYLDESKENGYWEELLASKIPATGHAFNADTGSCDNCGLANPVYTKVTSLDDINEEDLYIFVANVGDKYFVLGGLDESTGDEQGNVWGHEDGNAIEVIPYEDGSISLLNQNYVGTMKPSEFMLDVNPDQWNFTEIGLTTVMPLLPNYCVYSFQSYDLHNTGYMGVPRYADGMYGMWDGGAWAIDFYTTEVDENTYRDDMDGYTHAEQVARGNIDDNIAEGDLLMYPASFYSVGGAMFTLRFREYVNEDDVTEYYFICGEDGYLVGSGEWDSVTDTTPTNDIQYAISLYRYDVPSTPAHTCDFGDWVADTDSDTHTRTCKDTECGKTETKSHNWDNGVETKAPTCTEAGIKTYTCDDCSATKTEAVDNLGHDWSDWKDDGANATTDTHSHTCNRNCGVAAESEPHSWGNWTPDGDTNHKKTCSVCGGTRTATHSWNEGIITTQPTEEEEGVKTYTCSDCGHTKTEPVDKLEHVHSWSDWGQNDENTHIRSCRCNETQTAGHNFDDGVVINWPTHLAPGEIHYTCTDCGYVKIGTQPALEEHEWSDWSYNNDDKTHTRSCICNETETKDCSWDAGVVTKQPTHYEEGIKTYTCSVCSGTKAEAIAKTTEHEWSDWSDNNDGTHTRSCRCNANETKDCTYDSGVVTEQPTHTEKGIKTYTCTVCGHTYTEDIPVLTDHAWGEWMINKLDEANTHIRYCVCDESQTAPHNFDDGKVTTEATHISKGVKTFTCNDGCGYSYTEEIPETTEHEWTDWSPNGDGTHTRSCRCNANETKDCTYDAGVVTTPSTHYEEGVKTFTCTVCGHTKTEAIAKTTEHEWSDWSDNNDGTHTRSCRCNANETLAHTWGSWAVQNDGGYKRECADCGAFETMTLPENKPVNTTTNDNAANTNLTNTDIELIENVLTDEEQSQVADGAEVKVYLKVEDISNAAPAEHKEEAEAKAGDDEIGMYLDIDLFKQVGTAAETPVTETSGKVAITITIPKNLINTDASITRTYKIIRVHEDANGQLITDVIEGVFNPDDNSFTFETDKFSTYALAYADSTVPSNPQTGDNSMMALWIVLLCISSLGIIATVAYHRKRAF